jgi:hypothetical protein
LVVEAVLRSVQGLERVFEQRGLLIENEVGDLLIVGAAVLRFLDEELETRRIGLDDAEAAALGLVLVEKHANRGRDEGAPQPHLRFVGELALLRTIGDRLRPPRFHGHPERHIMPEGKDANASQLGESMRNVVLAFVDLL